MSLIFVCIIFTISSASAVNTTLANTCYDVQADFENACKTQVGGLVDGGRCYFSAGIVLSANWSHWWSMCEQYGAVLAQVHTSSELSKLEILRYNNSYLAAIGMLDADHPTQTLEQSIQPTAFWYDSATVKNTKLGASATWARTRANDDNNRNGGILIPRCFFVWPGGLGDEKCASKCAVLCQITNRAQNFTLTNYCLQETAVEVSATSGPFQCAQVCSSRPWCRSFNYITDAGGDQCQLFPWSINDDCTGCANRTQSTPTCSLYNYVI